MSRALRIGWIIGEQLENRAYFLRARQFTGGTPLVRFAWLAEVVNADGQAALRHEIYRPWARYDGLVFLKSMGGPAQRLAERARRRGVATFFDANVVYYSTAGNGYYRDMLPSSTQRTDAIRMSSAVDAVIADSQFIEAAARPYQNRLAWIPDNVRMDLVPEYRPFAYRSGRLRLLWSGQVAKLVDLLAIEGVLRQFAARLELVVVTNGLSGMERIYEPYRTRLRALLGALAVVFVPYRDPAQLFGVYQEGGVLVSPRFLDSDYNRGHTEWKITLALASGRVVLCSPVPSYVTVAGRAAGGIRICAQDADWVKAFEDLLAGDFPFDAEEPAAREVVRRHYATEVVAAAHTRFLTSVLERCQSR